LGRRCTWDDLSAALLRQHHPNELVEDGDLEYSILPRNRLDPREPLGALLKEVAPALAAGGPNAFSIGLPALPSVRKTEGGDAAFSVCDT